MNEQDKKAMELWLGKSITTDTKTLPSIKETWQAALEYARGQQEPVAKDAEEYGPRLNDAGWAAIEAWNCNSLGSMPGVVFNNIKSLVRAAILKYCEGYTTPPAKQQEPVASRFRYLNRDGKPITAWAATADYPMYQHPALEIEPLYTHPAQPVQSAAAINEQLLDALELAINYVPDDSAYDKEVKKKAESAIAAAEAQPVQPAVNEQMLRALKVAQGILFEAGYDIDDGGEHFSEYVQITDAIAAAEAAKGGAA